MKSAAGKVATDVIREPSLGNRAEAVCIGSEDLPLKDGDEDDAQPVEMIVLAPVWGELACDDGQSRNIDRQSVYS